LWHRFNRFRAVLAHRFWTSVCSSHIPICTRIAGGLLIPHPWAIVIHPNVEIGPNCLIFQSVTIGTDGSPRDPGSEQGAGDMATPRIAGHVDIGAGAVILGDVSIGEHSRIGANAVVLQDVPPYSVAVGVPARVFPIERHEALLRDE
jgi:serine O-acetyltransferase